MTRPLILALALCAASPFATRAAEPLVTKADVWNGYEMLNFEVAGKPALIVKPKTPAPGHPWIWRTEFFGHEPQGDLALLEKGWHVGYFKISDMYGAPPAVALMNQYHAAVVAQFQLNKRVVLEGFSRGGLYAVNFAVAYPDKTAALYLDAPVLDIRSWPGGMGKAKRDENGWKQALALYGLTEETAKDYKGNPIDTAPVLAKAGIPVIAVCGDADKSLPIDENIQKFEAAYRAAGGTIKVIMKPGGDHHPHSLKDPQPIVDFLLEKAVLK